MQLVHDVTPNYRVSANRHINKNLVFIGFFSVIIRFNYLREKQASHAFLPFLILFKFLVLLNSKDYVLNDLSDQISKMSRVLPNKY